MLNPAAAVVATGPLAVLASQQMRGMSPATPVIAGQFKQGQYLEQTFQMQNGKCYSAAVVGVGITTMKIQFVALQPIPGVQNPVLSEVTGSGQQLTLGNSSKCGHRWSLPVGINAKVVYTAVQGGGTAAGRVYFK